MARTHTSIWPAPSSTALAADVETRHLAYMMGELAGGNGQPTAPGVRAFLTDDGQSGGDAVVASIPWIEVQVADSADYTAVSCRGRWGPIMDPDDNRLAQDLFMWRWTYTGSRWAVDVYLTGLAGTAGQFDARSGGRLFLASTLAAGS